MASEDNGQLYISTLKPLSYDFGRVMCGFTGGLSCALQYAKVAKDGSHAGARKLFKPVSRRGVFVYPLSHLPNLALDFGVRSFTECVSESSSPTPPKEAIGTLGQGVGGWSLPLLPILKSPTT